METATFAGGCFWCTEAIFKRIKGVENVIPGYCSGKNDNPSYQSVSTGKTNHAEAIQFKFDPKIITYEKLTEIFFKLHDPTTLNRQGNDVGKQYRSSIFYHSLEQKETAQKVKSRFEKEKVYQRPIVTEIVPFEKFHPAERYHLDYYSNNPDQPYCKIIIDPKITKLYKEFKEQVRD